MLAVHPSLPVKSVKELVALAKARPGTLNYASGGTGSSPHMAMELFLSITRLNTEIVRIVHMPEVKDRLSGDGAEPVGTSPEQFAAFLKSEVDKWTKVARAAGIKPE